ncbi:hypothetical protein C8Q77DRAFT_371268 [Trametes polyzona]|nr:hypothetical protein C8Q77DRAFT_371268 [Trametes polyzona]
MLGRPRLHRCIAASARRKFGAVTAFALDGEVEGSAFGDSVRSLLPVSPKASQSRTNPTVTDIVSVIKFVNHRGRSWLSLGFSERISYLTLSLEWASDKRLLHHERCFSQVDVWLRALVPRYRGLADRGLSISQSAVHRARVIYRAVGPFVWGLGNGIVPRLAHDGVLRKRAIHVSPRILPSEAMERWVLGNESAEGKENASSLRIDGGVREAGCHIPSRISHLTRRSTSLCPLPRYVCPSGSRVVLHQWPYMTTPCINASGLGPMRPARPRETAARL